VKLILQHIMCFFNDTLAFRSMHSAMLRHYRMAHWLEAASKLAMPLCQPLLEAVLLVLTPQPPPFTGMPPAGAPGVVSSQQWKEGAMQLRGEVSHFLLL
jgi:hypothetical protein